MSLYPQLEEVKFETRFWGQLVATRVATLDEHSLDIQISLTTLTDHALDKITEMGPSLTSKLAGPLSGLLGIQSDQVVSVGEFEFVDKSLIVEVDDEVDLATLKVDPKALVSWLFPAHQ